MEVLQRCVTHFHIYICHRLNISRYDTNINVQKVRQSIMSNESQEDLRVAGLVHDLLQLYYSTKDKDILDLIGDICIS